MDLHNLKRNVKRPARKRVGRGNGNNWGRTCGRGEKGQKSRSGYSRKPYFEGGQIPLIRRLPKRGFKNPNAKHYAVVNVSALEASFVDGDTVDYAVLAANGLVGKLKNGLKILGNGELSKSLTVQAQGFSQTAREKIEATGGTATVVPPETSAEAPVAEEVQD